MSIDNVELDPAEEGQTSLPGEPGFSKNLTALHKLMSVLQGGPPKALEKNLPCLLNTRRTGESKVVGPLLHLRP